MKVTAKEKTFSIKLPEYVISTPFTSFEGKLELHEIVKFKLLQAGIFTGKDYLEGEIVYISDPAGTYGVWDRRKYDRSGVTFVTKWGTNNKKEVA